MPMALFRFPAAVKMGGALISAGRPVAGRRALRETGWNGP
jgi:hypothetical protein